MLKAMLKPKSKQQITTEIIETRKFATEKTRCYPFSSFPFSCEFFFTHARYYLLSRMMFAIQMII
jgi:hypothetical protein